jgi:hypothetical protein
MARHPLHRIRHAFPTIRFLLIVGGAVAFALAAVRADTLTGVMQNVGWLLLCATVLFLDPENPPGSVAAGDNSADPIQ